MNLVIRNYVSSVLVVMVFGVLLGNLYNQSSRLAGQHRVNTFGLYISTVLVAQAENIGH